VAGVIAIMNKKTKAKIIKVLERKNAERLSIQRYREEAELEWERHEAEVIKEHNEWRSKLEEQERNSEAGKKAIKKLKDRNKAIERLGYELTRGEIGFSEYGAKFADILKIFPVENYRDYAWVERDAVVKRMQADVAAKSLKGRAAQERQLLKNQKNKDIEDSLHRYTLRLVELDGNLTAKEFLKYEQSNNQPSLPLNTHKKNLTKAKKTIQEIEQEL
jgi:hypothetical protein